MRRALSDVPTARIVRGYPVNGGCIVLEDQEMEALEEATSRTIAMSSRSWTVAKVSLPVCVGERRLSS